MFSHSQSSNESLQKVYHSKQPRQYLIPVYEEDNTRHLESQLRILKTKIKHLQNHLDEQHKQFQHLDQLYENSQQNERKLMKENQEIRRKIRQCNNELASQKSTIEDLQMHNASLTKREQELKEKFLKIKNSQHEQATLNAALKSQTQQLKLQRTIKEETHQKHYQQRDVIMNQVQQLRATIELKNNYIKNMNEQVKRLSETLNEKQATISHLRRECEENQKIFTKLKQSQNLAEGKLKDLKDINEGNGAKISQQIEQIARLKVKVKDYVEKQSAMENSLIQLQAEIDQKDIELQEKINQCKAEYSNNKKIKNKVTQVEIYYKNKLKQCQSKLIQTEFKLKQVLQDQKKQFTDRKEIQTKQSANQAIISELSELKQVNCSLMCEINKLKNDFNSKLSQNTGSYAELAQKFSSLKEEIQFTKAEKRACEEKIQQLEIQKKIIFDDFAIAAREKQEKINLLQNQFLSNFSNAKIRRIGKSIEEVDVQEIIGEKQNSHPNVLQQQTTQNNKRLIILNSQQEQTPAFLQQQSQAEFQELQRQYIQQMQQIRKILLLKGYKHCQSENVNKFYQDKLSLLMSDYQAMQQEMQMITANLQKEAQLRGEMNEDRQKLLAKINGLERQSLK